MRPISFPARAAHSSPALAIQVRKDLTLEAAEKESKVARLQDEVKCAPKPALLRRAR